MWSVVFTRGDLHYDEELITARTTCNGCGTLQSTPPKQVVTTRSLRHRNVFVGSYNTTTVSTCVTLMFCGVHILWETPPDLRLILNFVFTCLGFSLLIDCTCNRCIRNLTLLEASIIWGGRLRQATLWRRHKLCWFYCKIFLSAKKKWISTSNLRLYMAHGEAVIIIVSSSSCCSL